MTEPARRSVADPERKPDPRASGWADVRQAVIACAHVVALAAGQVAARPGDAAALAVLSGTREAFESAVAIAGRWQVDEAVMEAERNRGYAAGYAACKAERRRLQVVDGSHA